MKKRFLLTLKTSRYLRFTLALIQFALIIALLDFITGHILNYYYFKQRSGFQFRTTYAIDSTKADILIFGSSRANHHYYSGAFESGLKMSYYNAGRDGNFIFYHYAVLKAVLKRYTPKIVILDFTIGEFRKGQSSYDRLSSLLPYYKNHPEMRSAIKLRGPFEQVKLLSYIYPYNSALFTIVAGNASFNRLRKTDNNGYVALSTILDSGIPVKKNLEQNSGIDPVKLTYYDAFISSCVKANVKVYIVCSPYFNYHKKTDNSLYQASAIASSYNAGFFDHSNDTAFNGKRRLFSDEMHLNDEGARKFSDIIVDQIATDLAKRKNQKSGMLLYAGNNRIK